MGNPESGWPVFLMGILIGANLVVVLAISFPSQLCLIGVE